MAAADHTLPDPAELVELERLAVELALEAGRLIVDERPDDLGVSKTKSSATDVVTVMDQRAQDLLRSANLTVTEICMAVGFSSLGSFSTRFSALVGEPPTQYRDRWAATGGPRIPGCYLFMMGVVPSTSPGRSASSEKPGRRSPA